MYFYKPTFLFSIIFFINKETEISLKKVSAVYQDVEIL